MTTMGNRLRHLRKRRNDTIAIDLCEDAFNTTHSRTTGEEICGWVWIRTGSRLSPGMLEIVFRGRSRVENNAILQPVRTYRQRNFLEMKQPIEKDDFTPYDALKNGFLYRFPFTFIVPGKLPIHACCHDGKFWNALNSHLVLPPSIERSSDNKNMSRFDDMCPENINIAYAVEATVASERAGDFRSKEPWNFASKKITIIPLSKRIDYLDSFDDLISSLPPSKFFAAQKKQTTELHLEYVAATSATIFLPLQHNTKEYTAIIPVKVTFESNHGGVPPKLSRISRKLVAHTTTKAVPFRASDSGPVRQSKHGVYTCDVSFSDLDVSSVQWETCPHAIDESDSLTGPACNSGDLMHGREIFSFEAMLQVPVSLSLGTKLAPSFDSCLISRSYTLEISLSYRAAGKMGRSYADLKIPLRLVAQN